MTIEELTARHGTIWSLLDASDDPLDDAHQITAILQVYFEAKGDEDALLSLMESFA